MKSSPIHIAIIGLGPKGLYGLERLLAMLDILFLSRTVEIHLFNKTSFMGSGDIYRSDQPDYLLMNFSNKHINMWPQEQPVAIVSKPNSFSEYLFKNGRQSLKEIDQLYASRAAVGDYLENGFAQLCQNLPEKVVLHKHIAKVSSIKKTNKNYTIGFERNGRLHQLDNFQNILITTGHQRHKQKEPRSNTIPFIYPVQTELKSIKAPDTVALKGLGLTFIDAVLALTEGKEGVFMRAQNGTLTYKASGDEPKCIYPFSISGWPMMPKYELKINRPLYIEKLRSLKNVQFNFREDILPLIAQDMEFTYYEILFAHEKEKLLFHEQYDEVEKQIKSFHKKHRKYKAFSIQSLLEPVHDSAKSTHQNVVDMLSAYTNVENLKIIERANLGAAAVWKKISPIFNDIYSFNGLDVSSHHEFDSYYFSKLNRIAYGPPVQNLKKILALTQAGCIDFSFSKNPIVETKAEKIVLKSKESKVSCNYLVDARIPKNSILKEESGLFATLCMNGLGRAYLIKDKQTTYAPGILEINHKGNLINADGGPENITLYGTPTEGIVHDNDTLSRSRNNFATPWAKGVVQQIIERENETKQSTAKSYTSTK